MSRTQMFVIYFVFMFGIVGAIHAYLWARLFRDTGGSRRVRRIGALLLVALAISIPFASFFGRVTGARAWTLAVFAWLGFMFFLFLSLLVGDLVFVVAAPVDTERRTLFRRALAGAASVVSLSTGSIAIYEALRRVEIKDVSITLARLPRALDGFKIVQISDVHVGSTIGRDFMEGLVGRIQALQPDLVAITGDLVDGSVARLGHAIAPLADLRAPHGTYFVTGNHEYYSGAAEWCAELSRIGIRVLRNERVAIERDGAGFDLVGVDDWKAKGLVPGHGADLERALRGRDPARECVLLAHQPKQAEDAARLGVDLQLSGHTHGGQLWPFVYFVKMQQPFIAGLDRLDAMQIYTSRGTGYWGPPMRLGAPAEITRITLRCAGDGRAAA